MDQALDEVGARIRAASAYAKLDEKAASRAMGFSTRTLARVEVGERDLTIPEAKALAAATAVPMRFFLDGWEIYEQMEERVVALREKVSQLRKDLEDEQARASERDAEVTQQYEDMRTSIAQIQARMRQ